MLIELTVEPVEGIEQVYKETGEEYLTRIDDNSAHMSAILRRSDLKDFVAWNVHWNDGVVEYVGLYDLYEKNSIKIVFTFIQ